MWKQVDSEFLGDLTPAITYLYYDGPRTFASIHDKQWFYIHQCDEDKEYMTFWVREATYRQLYELEDNRITIRDFIFQAKPLYLVHVYNSDTDHPAGPGTIEAFAVDPATFPDNYFPEAGLFLFEAHHE